jgi:hypothetical protein
MRSVCLSMFLPRAPSVKPRVGRLHCSPAKALVTPTALRLHPRWPPPTHTPQCPTFAAYVSVSTVNVFARMTHLSVACAGRVDVFARA